MKNGQYGLNPISIAIIAFVIGFFGFLEVLILVVAFAVMAEKDKWLTMQTLKALFLRLSYSIISIILGWVFNGFQAVLNTFDAYEAMKTLSSIQTFINGILYVALFIIVILAVLNLLKGKDVRIIYISEMVDYTVGIISPKATEIQGSMNVNFNEYSIGDVDSEKASRMEHEIIKESDNHPEKWICKCGKENSGKFCMGCGSPKNI